MLCQCAITLGTQVSSLDHYLTTIFLIRGCLRFHFQVRETVSTSRLKTTALKTNNANSSTPVIGMSILRLLIKML
jgi:hypothetical protein